MQVLICDDEPDVRLLFRHEFEALGATVAEVANGEEAVEFVRDTRPDLVILDLYMPGRDGLSVLPELRAFLPRIPILVVSAHAAVEVFGESRNRGATACFDKLGFHGRIPELMARFAPAF